MTVFTVTSRNPHGLVVCTKEHTQEAAAREAIDRRNNFHANITISKEDIAPLDNEACTKEAKGKKDKL